MTAKEGPSEQFLYGRTTLRTDCVSMQSHNCNYMTLPHARTHTHKNDNEIMVTKLKVGGPPCESQQPDKPGIKFKYNGPNPFPFWPFIALAQVAFAKQEVKFRGGEGTRATFRSRPRCLCPSNNARNKTQGQQKQFILLLDPTRVNIRLQIKVRTLMKGRM
jgi:hypothetical protein